MRANRILLVALTLMAPWPALAADPVAVAGVDHSALQRKAIQILALGPAFANDPEYLALQAGMASGPASDPFKQLVFGHMQGLQLAVARMDQGMVKAHIDALAEALQLDAATAKALLAKYQTAAAPK